MSLLLRNLKRRQKKIHAELKAQKTSASLDLTRYRNDPVGYFKDVLGFTFVWDKIAECALSLLRPPYRASVDSGHNVGKSHLSAALINWWYDTRNPSAVIMTAPTDAGVRQVVWTEVRLQRQNARVRLPMDFIGDSATEMRSSPDHFARGYTARDGNAFAGRHRANSLFLFDEKEGVRPIFWDVTKSMFRPGAGDAWIGVGNPNTRDTIAYAQHNASDADGNPTWHRFQLSSLDHPNIAAGLAGLPLPAPNAVTIGQVDQWMQDWADPVAPGDEKETDVFWRGQCYRLGPIGEPRILGLRPSGGTFGVWSEALWQCCCRAEPAIPADVLPVIGLDCANYGVDDTAWHSRCGPVSLDHRRANGLAADDIAARTVLLAEELAEWANKNRGETRDGPRLPPIPREAIHIQLDDDATGRDTSSILQKQKFTCIRLNAQAIPRREDLYPRCRDELWFMTAKKAALGLVNLSRLDRATKQRIELQLLAPQWWPDSLGRRCVESKDDLRRPDRLGRSPDDADAVNLAYYEAGSDVMKVVTPRDVQRQPFAERARKSVPKKRGLYGR